MAKNTNKNDVMDYVVPGIGLVDGNTHEPVYPENSENPITSMSDAAIVAANETLDKELVWAKNFRYAPTVHTADILKNTIESTGFDKNDIVTIALLVLESATREQLINATTSLMQDKSLALFTSLSK